MKLKVLGSGSSGNCYILENDKEALIIEAGVPFMEVKKALNFNIMKIKAMLVSHTHGDHAKYIPEYKKAGIPVFQPYDDYYMKRQYGKFKVFPFSLVHDVECYGFWIWHTEIGRLVYASDTEYVRWRFSKTTHLLVEANYDMQFVDRDEPNYEHRLRGHMSLDTALKFIQTNDNPELRNVVLIHLSDKCGDPALFQQKTEETIKYGADVYVANKGLEVSLDLCPF